MSKINMKNTTDKFYSKEWKEKNQQYLYELQKFFDIVDNIKDEELRMNIIYQMLKCDEILTKIAEENMKK